MIGAALATSLTDPVPLRDTHRDPRILQQASRVSELTPVRCAQRFRGVLGVEPGKHGVGHCLRQRRDVVVRGHLQQRAHAGGGDGGGGAVKIAHRVH